MYVHAHAARRCIRRDGYANYAPAVQFAIAVQSHVQYVARNEELVDRIKLKEETRSKINYIKYLRVCMFVCLS